MGKKELTNINNSKTTLTNERTIRIRQATAQGYIECIAGGVADLSYPSSLTRRGRVQGMGNISPTLTTESEICRIESEYRIRKLTSRECWRLMSFTDEDYDKASEVNSETQLYKEAGNSIVKEVLVALFSQLHIQGIPTWNEVHKNDS